MTKKMRILQILNLWRLLPAYLCVYSSSKKVKDIIFDELMHWKKCDQRKEHFRFDVFSALMLTRKEYRTLLQYRLKWGGYRSVL